MRSRPTDSPDGKPRGNTGGGPIINKDTRSSDWRTGRVARGFSAIRETALVTLHLDEPDTGELLNPEGEFVQLRRGQVVTVTPS